MDDEIKASQYEFMDTENLPPRKYKEAIEWDDEKGIWVNMEKFNALENEKVFTKKRLI